MPSDHRDGPEPELPDPVLIDRAEVRHIICLLDTCEQFHRTTASANVHTELSRFLATRGYRCPRTASRVFTDILGFTTHGIRVEHHIQQRRHEPPDA